MYVVSVWGELYVCVRVCGMLCLGCEVRGCVLCMCGVSAGTVCVTCAMFTDACVCVCAASVGASSSQHNQLILVCLGLSGLGNSAVPGKPAPSPPQFSQARHQLRVEVCGALCWPSPPLQPVRPGPRAPSVCFPLCSSGAALPAPLRTHKGFSAK